MLFDQHFNLKIADFGFAAPVAGRDGSGFCKTKLGTESYMAPEIHARRPYIGTSVDLFACAIILFIMITQHPPFSRAEPNDPFYRLLCANRADLFWKAHSKNKPSGLEFFSEEFRNLITSMLQFDPAHRLTMADVKAHPWLKGPMPSLEEIQHEFHTRHQTIEAENEAKRIQKEQERAAQLAAASGGRRQYRTVGVHRGDAEEGVEEAKHELLEVRKIDPYFEGVKKNTQFFSTVNPDELLGEIAGVFRDLGHNVEIDSKKYKLKAVLKAEESDDEEEEDGQEKQPAEEEQQVELSVKILKVGDADKYCVEFNRTAGDQLQFFEAYTKVYTDLADMANA